MGLPTVQIRVTKPVVGDDLVEENELRRRRDGLRRRIAELEAESQALEAEDERLGIEVAAALNRRAKAIEGEEAALTTDDEAGEGESDGDSVENLERDQERTQAAVRVTQEDLDKVHEALGVVQAELDRRLQKRIVTIDVQTATFGGRIRQMTAVAEVGDWLRAQRLKNLGLTEESADLPTDEELEAVRLTPKQREDYFVMSSCSAIVGAACLDEEGHPVCSNFDWPETLEDWINVPAYIVEPTLSQVYTLNPSWAPGWFVGEDEGAEKN